jgi:hypothetical protein
MHFGRETSRRLQFAIDKRGIEDQLGTLVGDSRTAPLLDLPVHRLEVPLEAVHANGKRINQVEALAVFGQDRRKYARDNVAKQELRRLEPISCAAQIFRRAIDLWMLSGLRCGPVGGARGGTAH